MATVTVSLRDLVYRVVGKLMGNRKNAEEEKNLTFITTLMVLQELDNISNEVFKEFQDKTLTDSVEQEILNSIITKLTKGVMVNEYRLEKAQYRVRVLDNILRLWLDF